MTSGVVFQLPLLSWFQQLSWYLPFGKCSVHVLNEWINDTISNEWSEEEGSISINKGRTGFFTRLWEDRGKAGTGPGQGPELCEEVCVRSHAAVGRGNECQEPLRTSHVPEAWMPQGRQRWNPLDNFSLQLIQLLSRLSPLQVEGPRAWRGHPCPRGKSGGRSKRQNLLPHRGERRGVCLLQLLGQPSRLGPQRSLRDRTPPVRGQIFRSISLKSLAALFVVLKAPLREAYIISRLSKYSYCLAYVDPS